MLARNKFKSLPSLSLCSLLNAPWILLKTIQADSLGQGKKKRGRPFGLPRPVLIRGSD